MQFKHFFKSDKKEDYARIIEYYSHPMLDPGKEAWQEVINHKDFARGKVIIIEIARLKKGADSQALYHSAQQKLLPAIKDEGGKVIKLGDVLMTGVGDLANYDYSGGVTSLVQYPSRAAYLRTLLTPAALEAREQRLATLDEVILLIVKDTLPPLPPLLTRESPASDFPTPRVDGKTPEQLVEELLSIYPAGGADPTRTQLETMAHFAGFYTTPVHYINLYKFNTAAENGSQVYGERAHTAYNRDALKIVRTHGARPYFRAQVQHNLLGAIPWDLAIFVRWPSFAVFTDLRLDPEYIEAQKYRVQSAQVYGNFVVIAREDLP